MTADVLSRARARAAAGARLLDARRPGWHLEIDLDALDMQHCNVCVLGQLYGIYGWGAQVLNLYADGATDHGFHGDGVRGTYRALGCAWAEEICTRLGQDAAALRRAHGADAERLLQSRD